jgi:hypothetical protein
MCRYLWNKLSLISLGISLGVILLDHMADLCLVFKEASILFFKVFVQAYISTSNVCGLLFSLASSPTFVFVGVFDDSYSNKSEVES